MNDLMTSQRDLSFQQLCNSALIFYDLLEKEREREGVIDNRITLFFIITILILGNKKSIYTIQSIYNTIY